MERRGFLRRLLGSAAVAVIAPDILAQIEEYQYVVEGKPRQGKLQGKRYSHIVIDDTFIEGRGFWAMYEGEMIAWSDACEVSLNMEAQPIDVTSRDAPYATFRPGPMQASFTIDNLHIVNPMKFHELFEELGATLDIVATVGETPITFSGQGIITEHSISANMDNEVIASATFIISGELIQTTAKDD